jgi:hypothetical protein
MSNRLAGWIVALGLGGCGPSGAPEPQAPAKVEPVGAETATGDAPTCDAAAEAGGRIARMGATYADDDGSRGPATVAAGRGATLAACAEDAWSAEAIACVAAAETGADLGACEQTHLTEAQRASYADRWAAQVLPTYE